MLEGFRVCTISIEKYESKCNQWEDIFFLDRGEICLHLSSKEKITSEKKHCEKSLIKSDLNRACSESMELSYHPAFERIAERGEDEVEVSRDLR